MLPMMCLWAKGLRFLKNCHSGELNKIVEAKAPMNLYDNHTTASCLHTDAARKGGYGHFAGAVSSSPKAKN